MCHLWAYAEYEMEIKQTDQPFAFSPIERIPEIGEFILVEFSAKTKVYYAAKVNDISSDEIQVCIFRFQFGHTSLFRSII